MLKTQGIHHVSSIVGHAQKNVDFYAGFLGLRLVKQTLNYDDKDFFHFYFGNTDGSTGLVTTFPRTEPGVGVIGGGQVGSVTYAVPKGSFEFWKKHFHEFDIEFEEVERWGLKRLAFNDLDGLELELLETDYPTDKIWTEVTGNAGFIGIESAQLISHDPEATHQLLTEVLGYSVTDEDEIRRSYMIHEGRGGRLEMVKYPLPLGRMGKGVVHHIAFEVPDTEMQAWHDELVERGYEPTEIKDRKYFQSIYFREPGGILIELASSGPGILVDETVETLGSQLLIPPDYEQYRAEILETVMPIMVRPVRGFSDYGYRNRYEYDLLQRKKEIQAKLKELLNDNPNGFDGETQKLYQAYRQEYLDLGRKMNQ